MGELIFRVVDVFIKLFVDKELFVVKLDLVVDGVIWSVICVSMGNLYCVIFGIKGEEVSNFSLE